MPLTRSVRSAVSSWRSVVVIWLPLIVSRRDSSRRLECVFFGYRCKPPLGPALLEPTGVDAGPIEAMDGLVSVGAERATAVSDHLAVPRQLLQPLLQLVDRDRQCAGNVPRGVLLRRPNVDQHDFLPGQSVPQLVAVDLLDVLAEIIPRGALDRGKARCRRVPQGKPQAEGTLVGDRIALPGPLPGSGDHPGGVKGLQVLGGVGKRLTACLCQLFDAAGR